MARNSSFTGSSSSPLASVAPLAARQHGLVTYEQLQQAGFTTRQIESLVLQGWLVHKRSRLYGIRGCPDSWERELHAVVLSAGEGAVASHAAAARLWRFCYVPEGGCEVTLGGGRRPRTSGVTVHRVEQLDAACVSQVDGIPVTSFARTVIDCSSRLTEFQLGRVFDDGVRRALTSVPILAARVEHLPPGKGRSVAAVRRLLAQRGAGFDPGGSASERRVLDVLAAAGLPLPVQQHPVRVDGRRYVLDFAYVEQRGFIEFYGLAVHSGASAVASDSARLTALSARGWQPLIFTDSTSDAEMVKRVAELLGVAVPSAA